MAQGEPAKFTTFSKMPADWQPPVVEEPVPVSQGVIDADRNTVSATR
jgi:hypothetical protein